MNVCSLNCQSVKNKTSSIREYILSHNFDVVALTETWLGTTSDKKCLAEMIPEGYDLKHVPRSTSTIGGGIALIFKSNIQVEVKHKKISRYNQFEGMVCDLQVNKYSFSMIILYRPPPSKRNDLKVSSFFEHFQSLLEQDFKDNLLLVGDLNFHLDVSTDSNAKKLLNILHLNGFRQLVHEPTHSKGHTLDVVITRDGYDFVCDLQVSDPALCNDQGNLAGDHFAIHFKIKCVKPKPTRKLVTFRRLRKIDPDSFRKDILASGLNDVIGDTDHLVQSYNRIMKDLIDKHAPLCRRVVTLRPNSPWYTPDLPLAKHTKRKAEVFGERHGCLYIISSIVYNQSK